MKRNSHGLLQLGREALAYCQCASALISGNKALFVSVDLIGEKNLVILELAIMHVLYLELEHCVTCENFHHRHDFDIKCDHDCQQLLYLTFPVSFMMDDIWPVIWKLYYNTCFCESWTPTKWRQGGQSDPYVPLCTKQTRCVVKHESLQRQQSPNWLFLV